MISLRLSKSRQAGLTMVELMVALGISMLITLAAIAALVVARRGFDTVDSASQMRDNMRFTSDLIQRLGAQTGYKDVQYFGAAPISASIGGHNNALLDSIGAPTTISVKAGQGINGSDILILRSHGSADGSVIHCSGGAVSASTSPDDWSVNVLHVALSNGELSLMCSQFKTVGFSLPVPSEPIIQAVENFQVLYGVDNVTPNTAPAGNTDSVPDRFLRADQMVVAGNPDSADTQANWRRVRSLRIGMVLRGPLNSQQEKVAQTFYPFGMAKASAGGAEGGALSSTNDAGTKMVVSTPDGRLRQTVTFTVHLRNDQTL